MSALDTDRDEAIQAIRERYEVAYETLRYTLPRLLEDEGRRAVIVALREVGWLDWQVLVALFNAAGNWRMSRAGIRPGIGDPTEARRLVREPETPESPAVPLGVFSDDALATFMFVQVATVAQRWRLRGRHEGPGEDAMKDLLIRRYRYAQDDIPHRDLLDCVDEHGQLHHFLGTPAEDE